MNIKILVTGGCGYIGSHTIIDLLENGYDVVSIDNLSNSNQEIIKKVDQITKKSFKNYVVDLCDINLVCQIFELEKPTHIIHFAAFKSVPESVQKPLKYYQNNLVSLINLLQLSQDFKVEKFIFSSSCSVYGNPSTLPVTENSPLLIAETPYASTKQMCEKIIHDFSKVSEIKFTILRYFNPVGNHQSGLINQELNGDSIFSNLIKSLQSNSEFTIYGGDYPTPDGTPIRDFIHVMDIARAHTLSIERQSDKFKILNLGFGKGISILEIIETFEKITNNKLNWKIGERRSGDVVEIYANNNLAKDSLNWKPKFSLEDMIRTSL
jgi:UDP-glucose 4-epimerase